MDKEKILTSLKAQKIKITPQRRFIIELMANKNAPMSAQEIYQEAHRTFPEISLDTVYRTLNLLVKNQLAVPLHLIDGKVSSFELQDPQNPHHHLICLACGKIVCLDECPLKETLLPQAQKLNFLVKKHVLEFYGYCNKCRKGEDKN